MIKQPRQKNEAHRKWIAGLPCLVCGNGIETEAAHIRYAEPKAGKRPTGMGEKAHDHFTVPLCGRCHREQHQYDELLWWAAKGIDPVVTALALWAATGNHELGEQIVRAAR